MLVFGRALPAWPLRFWLALIPRRRAVIGLFP